MPAGAGTEGVANVSDKVSSTKQKSHRGAAKRFRYTGSGKLKHRHAFRGHNFVHKSAKRRRSLRNDGLVADRDSAQFEALLPYPQHTR